MKKKSIVIGGGIIGLLTARELIHAGQQVTLIDRQQTGQESTWAGGGILSPLFPWRYLDSVTALASWSQAHYPAICDSLKKNTSIDPQYTQSGMLLLAPNEHEFAQRWKQQHHQNIEFVDCKQFQDLEPTAQFPDNAMWMPQVAQIRNPRLAKALAADIQQQGVTIITNEAVTEINSINNECTGVTTHKGFYAADNIIVSAGAWTQQLLEGFSSSPDIRPVRGQMLLFKTKPGTISRIVLEQNRYTIPRRDGRVLFGSTMEEVGFDKSTTQAAYDELRAIAIKRFPVLEQFPIEKHWSGLRPGSPAGVPYIAAHPQISNLFVNAGQFRNGIVLAPASARLVSDLVLNRTPIVDPSPYTWTAARG